MRKHWLVDASSIQKQLKDDFVVREYLRENCLSKYFVSACSDNLDEFVRFYDEVLVENRAKAERVAQLREVYASGAMSGATTKQAYSPETFYDRSAELEQLAKLTSHENSVGDELSKTLTQYKKTLVLHHLFRSCSKAISVTLSVATNRRSACSRRSTK